MEQKKNNSEPSTKPASSANLNRNNAEMVKALNKLALLNKAQSQQPPQNEEDARIANILQNGKVIWERPNRK